MTAHPQDLTLSEQAAAISSGDLDAAELLEATLARIEERNPGLGAVVDTFPERSEEMLAQAPSGPLHGVPVGLKDMFTIPWRAPRDGSTRDDWLPAGESGIFRRLRDAGAVIAGITQCHLYGGGSTGHVSATGPVGNPWDREHCAGGSSGGSASAVGARLVAGAVGSDGGGSIRLPASYCGVTGLKATFGVTPVDGFTHGYESLAASGPMCRDAADCRLLGDALLDGSLPAGDAGGVRIGVVRRPFWEDLDPEVETACREALEELERAGASLVELELDGAEYSRIATAMILTLEGMPQIQAAEVEEAEDMVVKALGKYQLLQPATVLLRAQRIRAVVRRAMRDAFGRVDALAWPATPAPAPRIDNPTVELPSGPTPADRANVGQAGIGNLAGVPGVSCPVGLHSSGLPIGLQFLTAWGADALALDVAEQLERVTERRHVDAVPAAAAVPA